jgi:hypothetical protein
MKINKFWAKMKMVFVGVGLMSIVSFGIFVMGRVFDIQNYGIVFIIIAFVSALIAGYSNHRRMQELKELS